MALAGEPRRPTALLRRSIDHDAAHDENQSDFRRRRRRKFRRASFTDR